MIYIYHIEIRNDHNHFLFSTFNIITQALYCCQVFKEKKFYLIFDTVYDILCKNLLIKIGYHECVRYYH